MKRPNQRWADIKSKLPLLFKWPGYPGQSQVEVLEQIEQQNCWEAIPALASLLAHPSQARPLVLETLQQLLSRCRTSEYISLDKRARAAHELHPWTTDYGTTSGLNEDHVITFLTLHTMHRNGYVRERALLALKSSRSPRILPFAALRLNDWVPGIQKIAKELVTELIDALRVEDVVGILPILHHHQIFPRMDYAPLLERVESGLAQLKDHAELLRVLQVSDPLTRRATLALMPLSEERLPFFLQLVDDPDPRTRTVSLQRIVGWADHEPVKAALRDLAHSRFYDQRFAVLRFWVETFADDARSLVEEKLLDASAAVRELAIFYWSKNWGEDPRAYYRARVPEPEAIRALAQVQDKEFASVFAGLLSSSSSVKVIKACLAALGQLEPDRFYPIFVNWACGSDQAVALQALKQILRCQVCHWEDVLKIHGHPSETVRAGVIRWVGRQGRWMAVRFLLQLHASETSPGNKALIVHFLEGIASRRNVFTRATAEEAAVIHRLLPTLEGLSEGARAELRLALEL